MLSGHGFQGADEAADIVLANTRIKAPDDAGVAAAFCSPSGVKPLEVLAIVRDEYPALAGGAAKVHWVGHSTAPSAQIEDRHSIDTSTAQSCGDRGCDVLVEVEAEDQSTWLLRMIHPSISSG